MSEDETNNGLSLRGISHAYDTTPILSAVDLTVGAGEVVCLLGPSGSGKSTLLRIVAGLEPLQSGEIWLNGARLAGPGDEPPPEARSMGLVFQDHVLFPHLTVAQNIAFGLRDATAERRREIVAERLGAVGLSGLEERYPHTLSGGQQQRVAVARALAPEPDVLLLDEPFASVDATLRRRLREDARRALKSAGAPAIVVTHDPEEALAMADRIVVMVEGRVVQEDIPERVWDQPADRFVAELFGSSESVAGEIVDGRVSTVFGDIDARLPEGAAEGKQVDVVIRPTAVHVERGDGPGTIEDVRFLGDSHLVVVAFGSTVLRSSSAEKPDLAIGDRVSIRFERGGAFVYNRE